MNHFIPLSVPNLKGNEQKYVADAIRTEWVSTAGSYVDRFEKNISEYLHVNRAVACQSGTAGLHLALLALGVTYEHEVIVPTLTFIAAVNPVRYVGSEPIFIGCDDSLCMDPIKLESFCKEECYFESGKLINNLTKKHVKAIIVVHVFGNMADMERICQIAAIYNLNVIEDATEALGTYYTTGPYKNSFAGTIGDVGVFSFNGNKIITTGGGGMVVAKEDELLTKIKYLSAQAKDDEINFIHNEVGYNYRMTNIQAAIGVAQLECLENFIEKKRKNYDLYKSLGINLIPFREGTRANYWFYSYLLESENLLLEKKSDYLEYLGKKGIQARPVWKLIHEQLPYLLSRFYEIDKAVYYQNRIINLPCSSELTQKEVLLVAEAISMRNS